jgi:hypothetical protein
VEQIQDRVKRARYAGQAVILDAHLTNLPQFRLTQRAAGRKGIGTTFLIADRTFGLFRVRLFIVYDLSLCRCRGR